jgi:hypothetical protein
MADLGAPTAGSLSATGISLGPGPQGSAHPAQYRFARPPPYDLRHAAVSLWLDSGVPATEVARRAVERPTAGSAKRPPVGGGAVGGVVRPEHGG